MSLALASHALAAIAYTLLLLGVWWWQRRQPPTETGGQGLFLGVVSISVAWAWAGVCALLLDSALLGGAVAVLDVLRIGAWQGFCLLLMRGTPDQPLPAAVRKLRWAVAAAIGVGLWVNFSPMSLGGILPWARNLPLLSMLSPILGLLILEQLLRSADETRWQVKPLSLALATMYVFDLYLNSHVLLFGRFDDDSLLARAAVHALPAPLLFVAARRRFSGGTLLHLSRNAALHTATLLFAGVYLLGISAIGYYVRYFGGEWGRVLALTLLCAALIFLALLVFSGSLRARARVFIGKHFFRYRYDYRVEWLRFTSMLTAKGSPEEVGQSVIKGLGALLHCRGGELWLRDADGQYLSQNVRWNMAERNERVALDSAMARSLVEREWILDLNEIRQRAGALDGMATPDWLRSDAASWLVIPLIVGEQLIGLVVLSQSNSALRLNWEVRDLLKTASRQAAGFLALMRATEDLLDARKFEAFNRMSAFVVHDLKNIVAQLSLMMQNARRLKDNPEFQEDMLSTVENSLEKMRRLMLQLREGATPVGVASGVPLAPIVRRMQAAARARGRDFELDLQADVATRGHTERLERVIGHLIDNAFDATEPSGRVSVCVSRSGSQAELVVSDTGKGMSTEFIQTRLFKPFQSTKQQGMGIGAYESFEYIKELGGDLKVESIEGQGTTIKVSLPLLDLRRDSDLGLKAS